MARCGRCALARALLRRAAETPEADPGRAGLFPIDDHVEALLPIEGDVGLVLGLEVARDFIDVGPLEHPAHQRAAKSAPLTTRLDPEQKQVPARALQIALARLPFAPDDVAIALIGVVADKGRHLTHPRGFHMLARPFRIWRHPQRD